MSIDVCPTCGRSLARSYERYGHQISRAIRKWILYYYDNKCFNCGKTAETFDIHHKDHDHTNNMLDNLIPLCRDCHVKHHNKNRSAKIKRKIITQHDIPKQAVLYN